MAKKRIIKNCHNCIWFEYYEKESYESTDQSGYTCNKRNLSSKLDSNIQHEKYQRKPKACHEPEKAAPND